MPFLPPDNQPPGRRVPTGTDPFVAPPADLDVAAAAFRQDNTIVAVARRLFDERYPAQDGYNPLDTIRGTPYEASHLDAFLSSRSEEETRSIMRRIDDEEADRKTLAASGTLGTVAQIAAGLLDPTVFLPAGEVVRGVRGSYSVGRSAAGVGAAAAMQAGIQEGVLQAAQETRSAGETAVAVGSATLLGAFLGAGAAGLLTRAERETLERSLDQTRVEIDAHAAGEAPSGLATAAGAAATDTRRLDLARTGLEFTAGLSPTRRTLSADSISARRTMADLAETPYRFTENEQGVASTQGPALSRIAKMEMDGTRVAVSDELTKLYSDYRFGQPDATLPNLRGQALELLGQGEGKLTPTQFRQQVGEAMRNGDQHEVPQVAMAAQFIRRKVFEPWKQRAIDAGLLPEGVDVKTADSYFSRVYNKELIRAERPAFVDKITDWLESDQAAKRQAQERIAAFRGALDVAEEQITKLTTQVESARTGLERVEIRAEEAGAGTRAVLEPSVRRRTNTLADQASGREARIADLEDRLAREVSNAASMREKIEAEIAAWEGKSVSEAKSALKAREKYAAEQSAAAAAKGVLEPASRLTGADSAIDTAVRRILNSERDLSRDDLRSRAHEIADRIIGSPDGRLPYDAPAGGPRIGGQGGPLPRGPLAAREFAIPDAAIARWLESDAERVSGLYLRTMVPDVLLAERFGDVDMTMSFRTINEDYAARIDAAKSEKERVRLGKERDAVIRDIAATRDRIRGVYGWSPDLRNMARVASGAKAINNLTSMGAAALSSLPDFAGVIFRHGFGTALADGWMPFFRSLTGKDEAFAKFKAEMRAMGIGTETVINARQHALDDVLDVYQPQSRGERALQAVSDKFFVANLLAPLTDAQKTIAAHVAVSQILRAADAVAKGKATKKQIANLAESGIDLQMAGRIAGQFEKGGEIVDGVRLPNTGDWTDRAAAEALNGAVGREVDIAVVTPGAEKPLWMSHPVLSLLGQFKAFTASATERILIANLQRRDAAVLQGLVVSMALGMLTYKLNAVTGGSPVSDRPNDWFKEGISRSGLLGWFEEGNALASKASRGGVDIYRMIGADKPLTRFASRSTLDMLLGPTAAKVESLTKVTGAAASRDWQESDTRALRRVIAGQNLFYVRRLFDQVESGANGMFGIEMRPRE